MIPFEDWLMLDASMYRFQAWVSWMRSLMAMPWTGVVRPIVALSLALAIHLEAHSLSAPSRACARFESLTIRAQRGYRYPIESS